MALTPEQCEQRTILKILAGSHVHGLNVETSDRDEEAIVIEPLSEAWSLGKPWEDTVRESPELDTKYFSLRKWCRMAANGNPNFLLMLFAPESHILKFNALGGAATGAGRAVCLETGDQVPSGLHAGAAGPDGEPPERVRGWRGTWPPEV